MRFDIKSSSYHHYAHLLYLYCVYYAYYTCTMSTIPVLGLLSLYYSYCACTMLTMPTIRTMPIYNYCIKLGLMKQFVKALDKEGECFKYLCTKFLRLRYEKIKAGIFDGPQI